MSKTVKEMMDGKGKNTYSLLIGMYFLQSVHVLEIRRAFQGIQGDFKLKHKNFPASLMPEKVPDHINVAVIPDMINEGQIPADPEENPMQPITYYRKTEKGLAEYYLLRKRITYVPESKVFTVVGLAKQVFMVRFPIFQRSSSIVHFAHFYVKVKLAERSCTCNRRGQCSHYMAVLMYLGMCSN